MTTEYIEYLSTIIPTKDSLKIVRKEAEKFFETHSADECHQIIQSLYASDNFQIQEIGVFLCGHIAENYPDCIAFLRDTVSRHDSWKVQEILAMAFDIHCKNIGYENAVPLIKEWLENDNANVRRAVSEGLRVWTSRPYFREHPEVAVNILSSHNNDESEYVRKSIGNALRDISKKHSVLIRSELATWDVSIESVLQVYKLANRWLEEQ